MRIQPGETLDDELASFRFGEHWASRRAGGFDVMDVPWEVALEARCKLALLMWPVRKDSGTAEKNFWLGGIFLLHGGANLVFFDCGLTLPSARVSPAQEDD